MIEQNIWYTVLDKKVKKKCLSRVLTLKIEQNLMTAIISM